MMNNYFHRVTNCFLHFWVFLFVCLFCFFLFFLLFRATPLACRCSQARGQIGAVASLYHSHSNTKSKPRLRPTQLTATPNPQPTERGQESNPHPHGYQSDQFLLYHNGNSWKLFFNCTVDLSPVAAVTSYYYLKITENNSLTIMKATIPKSSRSTSSLGFQRKAVPCLSQHVVSAQVSWDCGSITPISASVLTQPYLPCDFFFSSV